MLRKRTRRQDAAVEADEQDQNTLRRSAQRLYQVVSSVDQLLTLLVDSKVVVILPKELKNNMLTQLIVNNVGKILS